MTDRGKNWRKLSHGSKQFLRSECMRFAQAFPVQGQSMQETQAAFLELIQLGLLTPVYDDRGRLVGLQMHDGQRMEVVE
jgi:hypothetical protein